MFARNENVHQKECSLYLSNIDLELKLNDENKQILHRITKYMKSFYLEEYETEILRKDLIGMALEAETRGETLQNIIGDNINDFCDELIQDELGITFPKGKKLLHFASNLFIIKGMYLYPYFQGSKDEKWRRNQMLQELVCYLV